MANDLWKPYGENTGNLVYLSSKDFGGQLYIVDAKTGEVLDTGKFDKKYEDGRYIYRFNKPGSSFSDVVVISQNGEHTYIPDGSKRYEGLSYSQAQKNSADSIKKPGVPTYDPGSFTTTLSQGAITKEASSSLSAGDIPHVGNVALVNLLDPSALSFNRTEIEFTDPIETLRAIAAENKGQISENYLLSLQQAGQLSEANKNQLVDYLATMSPLQLQMVGIENAFNQQQKLQAAETATPGIANLLRGEVKNAQTLASGRLLRDAEDRALEQTARSAGADAAWTRGLGDDSLVGKRLSDQLSVNQRLGIMQQGQNYMNTAVQLANQTLMDTPNKAALSQQIPGTPQRTVSDIATQQWEMWNRGTTMTSGEAQSSIVQQRLQQAQLDANLQNEYNKYMYEIMAANTQAINTQNQDILNDAANTAASERRALAYQQAALAFQNKMIDRGEYEQILAQIEQTGTVDMSMWSDQWEDFWNRYQEHQNIDETRAAERRERERERLSRENSDINSGRATNNTNNTTGGNAGNVGAGNDSIWRDNNTKKSYDIPDAQTQIINRQQATPRNNILLINSSGQTTKIIDNAGYINLPQRNENFNSSMSYWEYINTELDDTDLSGVF